MQFTDRFRQHLGWCPNEKRIHTPAINLPDPAESRILHGPDAPRAGQFFVPMVSIPRWMTAASLLILFGTLFAGGSFWWPVFVMIGIIAFTIILCLRQIDKGVMVP